MSKAKVTIFEVGPRDGLQNENRTVSTDDKAWFISQLARSGLTEIEVGSFVKAEKVPQMADTEEIFRRISSREISLYNASTWALVPNVKGLERAIAAGVRQIAVFTAASNTFNQKNIGKTIEESFSEIRDVIREAKKYKMRIRGYVSTVYGCPFEGQIAPKKALTIMERLVKLGITQLSIGVADPAGVAAVLKPALRLFGPKKIAVHFHDTRGTALANTLRALDLGITTVDSSTGGLGGCPFAPGAAGNLATEDLLYMLNGMGMSTGVDLNKLCETSLEFHRRIGRLCSSKYLMAYASDKQKQSI